MNQNRQLFSAILSGILISCVSCHGHRADTISTSQSDLNVLSYEDISLVDSSKYPPRIDQDFKDSTVSDIVYRDLFMGRYQIVERLDTFTDDYRINLYLYDVPEDTIFVKTCPDCDIYKYPNKSIAVVWNSVATVKADTTILTSHRLLDWYRSNINPLEDINDDHVGGKDNWTAIWGMWKRDEFLRNDTITIETTLNIPDTDASRSFYYKNWHYGDSIIYMEEATDTDGY
ncbi:MAG: hypothetical protein K2I64_03285 [Muribaculaceae bacterium]|nr:hypothetical protein [Muribaculaceae bacterium]